MDVNLFHIVLVQETVAKRRHIGPRMWQTFQLCRQLPYADPDKDKAFEQLKIPEKFNVCADKLVTYAMNLAIITKDDPAPLLRFRAQMVLE
jgi:hypothetical protein